MPHPFVIFAIILAVIWTLSGLATWANKQKEAERRERLRRQLARTAQNASLPPIVQQQVRMQQMQQRTPLPPSISQGIAARFPDVLLPPALQARPIPPVRPKQPRAQKASARKGQRQPQPARPAIAPPPLATSALPVEAAAPPRASDIPAVQTARTATSAPPRISAATLAKWMTPGTLNQQFLLTEIFQPPVGLRDRHL